MQNTISTLGTISWGRRLMRAAAALGLLLAFGFAQTGLAQSGSNQLTIFKNYFVTGDYVAGGWVKGGTLDGPLEKGTITIPDPLQPNSSSVPVGADIVAAFLYWETVESSHSQNPGQNGSFNGYAISGSRLPTLGQSTTSWSPGGCSGNSNGSKIVQGYRADVRPFLPLDANGKIQANTSYTVELADTGTNGGSVPFTLGASLVIIYRVQASPAFPLNSIVIYDGTFAPSNATPNMSEMSQQIAGFYQAAASPVAKLTHIVGGGQLKKNETVSLTSGNNTVNLPSLYGDPLDPFPGIYNGSWDNPTWTGNNSAINTTVKANDASETTSVTPTGTNGNCLDWSAVVLSTRVPDPNLDALLPVWKAPPSGPPGYTDVISNQFVALPGAHPNAPDIFVEIDYLSNLDGNAGPYLHSHLPQQAALDMVGDAFAAQNVHIHFDVGPTNYAGKCSTTAPFACPDPYIIQGGTGGNAIPESVTLCNDAFCRFPGTPAVGWKGGFLFIKQNASVPNSNPPIPLGNFQLGRKDSYHYVLFAHALGAPRSFWNTFAATLQNNTSVAKLISIVNSGTSATVTIQTPPGLLKPGDCPNALIPPCSDANVDRITVTEAIGQRALNGTYHFTNLSSSTTNNITTTTFNIATTNTTATCTVTPCVADGTYNFSNEPHLTVTYGGPRSPSGRSDLGGGDSVVTFGLWPTDDVAGCQADPSVTLTLGQTYCTNQVGTTTAQGGTLLHEMGHTFFFTHGGTFFPNGTPALGQQVNNPLGPPTYGLNCNPGFLSSMNYLFQIRGFPDGGIDYSGQTLPNLSEKALNESDGIGSDMFTPFLPAAHYTRWYAPATALDAQLGHIAARHCNGSRILDGAQMVRIDGSVLTEPSGFSGPIDWNNDGNTTDTGLVQDINFNDNFFNSPSGSNLDSPFAGFNDWINRDLRQVGSRANTFGFSAGGDPADATGGDPADATGGDPADATGGDPADVTGGDPADVTGGDPADVTGGAEQDENTACSTADPPSGLMASQMPKVHNVNLNWTPPGVCLVSRKAGYTIWRAVGFFTNLTPANRTQFTSIGTADAPTTTFTDNNVKNNVTYTYFVTDTNTQGATSGASNLVQITVSF
jgi:hypothetical protein